EPGYEDEFISVVDLNREVLGKHPWNLQGGAAPEVAALIEDSHVELLRTVLADDIGPASFPGLDEAFFAPKHALLKEIGDPSLVKKVLTGDIIRDWGQNEGTWAFSPYDINYELLELDPTTRWYRWLWPMRTSLSAL